MDLFESTSLINAATFKELKWHIRPRKEWIHIIIYTTFFCLVGFLGIIFGNSLIAVMGFFIGIGLGVINPWLTLKRLNRLELKRIQEIEGISEIKQTVSFDDDKIKIVTPSTGSQVFMEYRLIDRLVETENLYALFTKENLLILVNKLHLIQEQSHEEFLVFIKEKCKTARIGK